MKVLITGIAGFIGANLARTLLAEGAEVHGIVRSSSDLWRLEEIQEDIHLHTADMNDRASVHGVITKVRPADIYHMAVYGAYPSIQIEPEKILQTSIFSTLFVLDAAREAGVDMVVNAGTSSEYGTKDHPMNENEIIVPNSYYAVGKAAQTHLAQYTASHGGPRSVTLRFFSVYGPFEGPSRFVPNAVKNALRGTDVPVSDPSIGRDFIYISDAIDACLKAARMPELSGEVINVGTGKQQTLGDVFNAVIKETGSSSKMAVGAAKKREFDTSIWVADASKMKETLMSDPKVSLAKGIAHMVKWFPQYRHVYEN
jgi:nucleoside-diphosphate-sugar epimerase